MPLLKLETNVAIADSQRQQLQASLSKVVEEATGKPEQYVMITIQSSAILMAGKAGAAALVDLRSIGGLSGEVNRELSKKICALLSQALSVPPNRVYLNFSDVSAENWGWGGSTFG